MHKLEVAKDSGRLIPLSRGSESIELLCKSCLCQQVLYYARTVPNSFAQIVDICYSIAGVRAYYTHFQCASCFYNYLNI